MTHIFGIILLFWFFKLFLVLNKELNKSEKIPNYVSMKASEKEWSEYKVFYEAGRENHKSKKEINEDFVNYIKNNDEYPSYVRGFSRDRRI